jgi:MFS family permease
VRTLFRQSEFRRLAGVAALLGLFTIASAFLFLAFDQLSSFETEYFPLLYAGAAIAYVVLAVPVGRVADRVGRAPVFLAGYVLLLGAYVLLLGSLGGAQLLAMLALLGAWAACTDGVLAAMTSIVVPRELRTTGLAVLTTVVAGAAFVSSLAFGWCWTAWGPERTIEVFALALVVAIVVAVPLLGIKGRRLP